MIMIKDLRLSKHCSINGLKYEKIKKKNKRLSSEKKKDEEKAELKNKF